MTKKQSNPAIPNQRPPAPPAPPKARIVCEGRYIVNNGVRWPAKDSWFEKLLNFTFGVKND